MVVFTCNHCGDSLQKPRVEKHYQTVCRNIKSLTCVDCFKDFKGEDYTVHTKCVTEQERYSAKGSIPNGVVKKGEAKQESWTEMIKSILDTDVSLVPGHRNLLNIISQHNNVPRKKVKFLNFIKSSSGGRVNMKDVEAVWNIIEKHKDEQINAKSINGNSEETKETKEKLNASKRKADETVECVGPKKKKTRNEEPAEEPSDTVKFSFEGKILEIMKTKNKISTKKLQKKVLNAYLKHTGLAECTEKTVKKYNKKLKKMNDVKIDENHVVLIEQ